MSFLLNYINKTHQSYKVFCVGRNKTGTTSIGKALVLLGFKLGKQSKAERLMEDWGRRDFRRIINYCKSADAFQDVPFSLDYTYQVLDESFPNAKFILTVRNNSDEWYQSLVKFHTKILKKNRLPTPEDLKNFSYVYKGWFWRQHQLIYGIDESTLYDPIIYKKHYEMHNESVINYFKDRRSDLLILNLSEADSMEHLCQFLDVAYVGQKMPYLNKT
jgi:hypothetical protein